MNLIGHSHKQPNADSFVLGHGADGLGFVEFMRYVSHPNNLFARTVPQQILERIDGFEKP